MFFLLASSKVYTLLLTKGHGMTVCIFSFKKKHYKNIEWEWYYLLYITGCSLVWKKVSYFVAFLYAYKLTWYLLMCCGCLWFNVFFAKGTITQSIAIDQWWCPSCGGPPQTLHIEYALCSLSFCCCGWT